MAVTTKFPFSLPPGLGTHVTNGNIFYTGVQRVDYSVYIGQVVDVDSNVIFNTISASTYYLSPNVSFFDGYGINLDIAISSPFIITENLTVNGDMIILGTLTAPSMSVQYSSSSTLYDSGSTKMGDSLDDTHEITGSATVSGSWGFSGTIVTRISQDITLSGSDSSALISENAAKVYVDTQTDAQQTYLRSRTSKTGTILSESTASFNAVTSSAPSGISSTTIEDFIFFYRGQMMEQSALTIEQAGTTLNLYVDTSDLGYIMEADSKLIALGKFN